MYHAPVEMSTNNIPYSNMSDEEIIQTGKNLGYGNWLQPIINANDNAGSHLESPTSEPQAVDHPRRSRGRPRVTKPRDESAIEKRRAQVREAQRTYQKRKDTVTASEKRRADQLLQLLADLSSDVEALLETAAKAGTMYQRDDVSKHIQRLWHTFDTVINDDSVKPELRLQQIKNDNRQAQYRDQLSSGAPLMRSSQDDSSTATTNSSFSKHHTLISDPGNLDFSLEGSPDITVFRPVGRVINGPIRGRSIFDILKERRQAALKDLDSLNNNG